eukprot:COSAG05_NODE_3699_length_1894_cov_398.942714_1_plen_38_part_10
MRNLFLPHYSIDSAIVFDHYNDTVTQYKDHVIATTLLT